MTAEMICPTCRVERADYEGPGAHLPTCPNCGVDDDPEAAQQYRADGWPPCPRCGEDELWSFVSSDNLADYFAEPLRCYRCNWTGMVEARAEVQP